MVRAEVEDQRNNRIELDSRLKLIHRCSRTRRHFFLLGLGLDILSRRKIRDGVVKVMANPDKKAKCPRYNQVRMVSFYHVNAKGPILARSMVRKVLGNEEFCMQIDAHSTMVKDWDEIALTEWKNTRNEYGIITHIPYPIETLPERSGEGPEHTKVSRQCRIRFRDNKFPVSACPELFYIVHEFHEIEKSTPIQTYHDVAEPFPFLVLHYVGLCNPSRCLG